MTDFSKAVWRKSTRTQQSGQCVEIAAVDQVIGVRDSQDPAGPVLVFSRQAFAAFVRGVTRGELDERA